MKNPVSGRIPGEVPSTLAQSSISPTASFCGVTPTTDVFDFRNFTGAAEAVGQDASLAERHVSESQAKAPPSRYRLFRPDNPATALEMTVNHLMWSRLLVGQINRGHYRFVLDGKNRAVFFIGWSVRRAAKHG